MIKDNIYYEKSTQYRYLRNKNDVWKRNKYRIQITSVKIGKFFQTNDNT